MKNRLSIFWITIKIEFFFLFGIDTCIVQKLLNERDSDLTLDTLRKFDKNFKYSRLIDKKI